MCIRLPGLIKPGGLKLAVNGQYMIMVLARLK
jgi:hypothetical protein